MTRSGRMIAAATTLVVLVAGCGGDDEFDPTSVDAPAGTVVHTEELARDHVEGDLDYPRSPPVGGAHNPFPQNCGVYSEPVPDENAVHSMEHGAVWIAYSEDLPPDEIATLAAITDDHDYVLVAPHPGLDTRIVMTAWGFQLALDDPEDARVQEFVDTFEHGPQAPEPGSSCSKGMGEPN